MVPSYRIASPKGKRLAKSASKTPTRGGVLSKDEQQQFQSWLKRQRLAGSSAAIDWQINHNNESWRRDFHETWKVQRANTKSTAEQTTEQKKIAEAGGSEDWYTRFEFAKLECIDPESDMCIELFSKLPKRANRNPAFADLPAMEEACYSKQAKVSWKELNSRSTTSTSSTDLAPEDADALERHLAGQAERAISNLNATPQQPKIKQEKKPPTVESLTKKMKAIHKSLGAEKILSEGYMVKLQACPKVWARDYVDPLTEHMKELTVKTNDLFMRIGEQHTMEEILEINVEYDKFLTDYRRGVIMKVVALLSGPN